MWGIGILFSYTCESCNILTIFILFLKGDFIALFINKTFYVDTPCHGAMYNIACVSRHCHTTSWFYSLVKMTHSGNPNLKAIIGFFQHNHFTFTKTNLDLSCILTSYMPLRQIILSFNYYFVLFCCKILKILEWKYVAHSKHYYIYLVILLISTMNTH